MGSDESVGDGIRRGEMRGDVVSKRMFEAGAGCQYRNRQPAGIVRVQPLFGRACPGSESPMVRDIT